MRRLLLTLPLLVLTLPVFADRVSGYVLDGSAKPLAGAKVTVKKPMPLADEIRMLLAGETPDVLTTVETDDEGRYEIDVAPNTVVDLRVNGPGLTPVRVLSLGKGQIPPLLTSTATTAKGRVTVQGKPLAAARLLWLGPGADSVLLMTRADEAGRFEVPDPAEWSYGVLVSHPDVGTVWTEISRPGRRGPIEIDVSSGAIANVKVVDPDGAPLPSVVVGETLLPAFETDDSGHARFHVSAEGVAIHAKLGELAGSAVVGDGETTIRLREASGVKGRILVDGTPVGGAFVRLFAEDSNLRFETTSGDEGAYELAGVPPGSYRLFATVPEIPYVGGDSLTLRPGMLVDRELKAEAGKSLQGRVVNEDGEPVAGAIVREFPIGRIERLTPDGNRDSILFRGGYGRIVLTSADGTFRLAGAPTHLIALHDAYAPAVSREIDPGKGAREDLTITMTPGVELSGTITDPDGKPLAGARIAPAEGRFNLTSAQMFQRYGGRGLIWPAADEEGAFRIRLNPGRHALAFHEDGYLDRMVEEIEVREGLEPLKIVLERGAVVAGTVRWSDGDSTKGLAVMIMQQDRARPEPMQLGENGRFTFDGLTPGKAELSIGNETLGIIESRTIAVPSSDLAIELDAGRDVVVQATDALTGAPVDAEWITIERLGAIGEGARYVSEPKAEADGTYVLKHVSPGGYRLSVQAEGYVEGEAEPFEITPAAGARVAVSLTRGRTVRGVVRDESGEPLASVMIGTQSAGTMSDVDGKYELTGVELTEAVINFQLKGWADEEITLKAGDANEVVDAVLKRGFSLAGVVHDEAGEPVGGAWIWATTNDGTSNTSTESEGDGSFELSGMAAGVYEISVRSSGYEEWKRESLDPAVERTVDIRLLKARTGTIVGTVVGLDGAELSRTWIGSYGWDYRNDVAPDRRGHFRMEGVRAGSTRITARVDSKEGGRTAYTEIDVVPDVENFAEIRFDPGFVVTGRITRDGKPVPGAKVEFTHGSDTTWAKADDGGRYRVENLTIGDYQVEVSSYGGSFSKGVRLEATRTLDLDVRGATVSGRVVARATGAPLVGAELDIEPASPLLRNVSNARGETDMKGKFRLEGLSGGDFVVRCEHEDFGQQIQRVHLADGQDATVDFAMDKHEGIHVKVVDARTGRPLSGTVAVRDMNNLVVYDGNPPSTGEGLQVPIPAGAYKLSASASGFATETVRITVPGPEVAIPLRPGGTLVVVSESGGLKRTMKLVRPDGEEYVQCWCNRISDFVIRDKRNEFEHIAAGEYSMRVTHADGSLEVTPVSVIEGGSVEVRIR